MKIQKQSRPNIFISQEYILWNTASICFNVYCYRHIKPNMFWVSTLIFQGPVTS